MNKIMADKEKILAEIEKVKLIIQSNKAQGAFTEGYIIGQESVLEHFDRFMKSISEEHLSKDFEEKVIPTKLQNVFNDKNGSMSFDVDTPRFIKEVCENSGSTMYDVCWNIFKGLLAKVAERATEIHDPVLDVLMIRLNLYEIPNEERYKIISELKEIYDNSTKEE